MNSMPVGYRFYPTEQELIEFYLHYKLENTRQHIERVIPVVNVYELDPWRLPQLAGESSIQDPEQWFFFCPRQQREVHGGRPTRTTPSGFWKATGSPSFVYSSNRVIGAKKTMVFYQGRAPFGSKTKWKMNEYKALDAASATPTLRNEFSLCRVYIKSGSLRSFDRRPVGESIENQRMVGASSSTAVPSTADSSDADFDKQLFEGIDLELLLDWF